MVVYMSVREVLWLNRIYKRLLLFPCHSLASHICTKVQNTNYGLCYYVFSASKLLLCWMDFAAWCATKIMIMAGQINKHGCYLNKLPQISLTN